MDKVSKNFLVGQPIFNQILKLLPKELIYRIILEMQSDRYYKSCFTWDLFCPT
ncbi:MAG: DUF4372 domain-containing protein [Prevotellaceae bacterium]|nr:DUF4372 domain-containing protein [Prevotellaceae bacterium]